MNITTMKMASLSILLVMSLAACSPEEASTTTEDAKIEKVSEGKKECRTRHSGSGGNN